MSYYDKYLKYKNKYLVLKQQLGGDSKCDIENRFPFQNIFEQEDVIFDKSEDYSNYNIYIDSNNINCDKLQEHIRIHQNNLIPDTDDANAFKSPQYTDEYFIIVDENIKKYLNNKYVLFFNHDTSSIDIYNILYMFQNGWAPPICLCVNIDDTNKIKIINTNKTDLCVFIIHNESLLCNSATLNTDNDKKFIISTNEKNIANKYDYDIIYKNNISHLNKHITNQLESNPINSKVIKDAITRYFRKNYFRKTYFNKRNIRTEDNTIQFRTVSFVDKENRENRTTLTVDHKTHFICYYRIP